MEEQRRETSRVAACGFVTIRLGADGQLAGEPRVSMRALGYKLRDEIPTLSTRVAARVVELVQESVKRGGALVTDREAFREFITAGIDDLTAAETGGRVPTFVHVEAVAS